MPVPPIGARIARHMTLDAAAIREGATLVGDRNPLHHDAALATASRFGGLIASGAHTCALLCGLPTGGFGDPPDAEGLFVGVDYNVRFMAPVRADRELVLEWVVKAHEPHRSGTLARLDGRISDAADGSLLLAATMAMLYLR